ncbi:MAG: glucose-6-phosphate isomerase, partial [Alphaproteobacteria bacterium]
EVDGGALAAFDVCRQTANLADLEKLAGEFRARCDSVAVLGIGGSSLGGQALCALSMDSAAPNVRFFDNIDPATLDAAFAGVAPERVGLVIISKSGGTAETLAQALTLVPQLADKVGEGLRERVVVITEPGDTPLRRLAARWNFDIRDHDPGIEGRYAVFSLVGLLPALIAGVDAKAVRAGAAAVLSQALDADGAADVPAAAGAAVSVALARERGAAISVLMPYSDRLIKFAQWYRQLWAESLGKGGAGTTPVEALGAVDQHSQLQLYLDGPADKMFTLVTPGHAGTGATIDAGLAGELGLDYLAGRTVGDLMAAEQHATVDALVAEGCPTRVLAVDRVDAATVGALMMHYMLESVIAARLFGVDPFDQPAVEDSKVRARAYLKAAK